jgi:hypothetical protein
MKSFAWFAAALFILGGTVIQAQQHSADATLVDVRKIWDAAPHNAFTDLARFQNRWFCVFREGKAHVSPDGALRVISSTNGVNWESAALITSANADLRDAKITVTPEYRLMLSGAAALHQPATAKHQSRAWFSRDGYEWSKPYEIGDPNFWLWRVTWHDKIAWCMAYETTEKSTRLYRSKDGKKFSQVLDKAFAEGAPSESTLLFLKDDTCLCLLRRDKEAPSGQLGVALPPYKKWEWRDLGVRIGGQNMISLPDGRIVVASRLHDGAVRTSLLWLDPQAAKLTEFLKLPSGGDCSYAGLALHEGFLWVSYYSSHEGKTSIYFAKVKIAPPNK